MPQDRAFILAELIRRQEIEWRLKGGRPAALTKPATPLPEHTGKRRRDG